MYWSCLPMGSRRQLDFKMTGEFRQLLRMYQFSPVGVHGLQQRRGEASGGSEAGPGRNVGEGRDLDLRRPELLPQQRLTNDRMADLIHLFNVLERRIFEVDALGERPVYRDVHVLVDRGGEQEAIMAAVVRRQIGAAASKGDAKRTARDDHCRVPAQIGSTTGGCRAPGCKFLRSKIHGLSRKNATVLRMLSSMLSFGRQPRARILVVSRKMNGLSPAQPRSPPV